MTNLSTRFALLAAFVSLLGVSVVAHAAGPVRCEVTEMGKKVVKEVATEAECAKLGGKVVKEAPPKK